VEPGAIVENKRLGAALALVRERQAAYASYRHRYDPARQRPPDKLRLRCYSRAAAAHRQRDCDALAQGGGVRDPRRQTTMGFFGIGCPPSAAPLRARRMRGRLCQMSRAAIMGARYRNHPQRAHDHCNASSPRMPGITFSAQLAGLHTPPVGRSFHRSENRF